MDSFHSVGACISILAVVEAAHMSLLEMQVHVL